MGECEFFLYREDNSELEMVRELISGDKGILRCLANVEEPGIYNVTFRYYFFSSSLKIIFFYIFGLFHRFSFFAMNRNSRLNIKSLLKNSSYVYKIVD